MRKWGQFTQKPNPVCGVLVEVREVFGLGFWVFGNDVVFRTAWWTQCLFFSLTKDRNASEETQHTNREREKDTAGFVSRGIKMPLRNWISEEHQGRNPFLSGTLKLFPPSVFLCSSFSASVLYPSFSLLVLVSLFCFPPSVSLIFLFVFYLSSHFHRCLILF